MKNILLIYPLNFLKKDAGNNVYAYNIVKQLKKLGFNIDLLSFGFFDKSFGNMPQQNKKEKLLRNIFIYNPSSAQEIVQGNMIFKIKIRPDVKKYYLFGIQLFRKHIKQKFTSKYGFVTREMADYFQNIINKNKYDFIYIHYIWIADILNHIKIPTNTKKIYSMHDADFLQRLQSGGNIGEFLNKEIDTLSLMDKYLCISFDEKLFFSKFLPNKQFVFLPPSIEKKNSTNKTVKKDIDALFLGHNNPYNIAALKWLIQNVLPILDKRIHLTVCGKVLKGLSEQDPQMYEKLREYNVNTIDFADDLDELLNRTKISLVPMFGGTGMKIKTVDAMCRDIPVVSTLMGVDGFPDKMLSGILVTDRADEFVKNIEKLFFDDKFYKTTQKQMHSYYNTYFNEQYVINTLKEIFA